MFFIIRNNSHYWWHYSLLQIYLISYYYSHCSFLYISFRSDKISRSVVSDSLRPHESQHARPPCPSPTPGVHWDSHPSSQRCHPAISSSVIPFSSCPQSLPASESFPMSQLFSWGGQRTGVSALASFLPKNTQGWSPSEWTGWISLQSKGLFKSLLQHHSSKASILQCSAFFTVQLSHPYMTTGKTIALTRRTFVGKVMSLLLNMLCRLVITFFPRSKCLLISWLQSPSAVILEPLKIKSATVAHSCFKDMQSFRIFDMIKHPVLDVICYFRYCFSFSWDYMYSVCCFSFLPMFPLSFLRFYYVPNYN